MSNNENFTINSSSIKPLSKINQTQVILQRHCDYDRANGDLMPYSTEYQNFVATSFINGLKSRNIDDLRNTYFLFDSSNTISNGNFKRCVETNKIVMNTIKNFFEENDIPLENIINLDDELNYDGKVHENKHLTEPKMFTDSTGFLDYLKDKHGGINLDFWIDFESDLSKDKREELNAEGPDEIVQRALWYIKVLQRYSKYFHIKKPNSNLIIWSSTHYDLISPLVKQKVLDYDKSDVVNVDYCGGISLLIDESNNLTINVNGVNYNFDFQYNEQPHQHL